MNNEIMFGVIISVIRITKVLDVSKNIPVIYNHIDNVDNTIHVYQSYKDIYVHGNKLVLNIRNKIFNKKTISLNDRSSKKITTSPYWVTLSAVVGNPSKNGKLNPDFYGLVPKNNENNYEPLIVQNYEAHNQHLFH